MDGMPLREAIEFGLVLARGGQPPARAAVRLYVMGERTWRDFDAWPPAGYAARRFHLQPVGVLSAEASAAHPPYSS